MVNFKELISDIIITDFEYIPMYHQCGFFNSKRKLELEKLADSSYILRYNFI
jgi:hypothetical protein